MRYELWRYDDDKSRSLYFMSAANYAKQLREGSIETDAEFIWAIEADTYNEACAAYHAYMGWEPYKPNG